MGSTGVVSSKEVRGQSGWTCVLPREKKGRVKGGRDRPSGVQKEPLHTTRCYGHASCKQLDRGQLWLANAKLPGPWYQEDWVGASRGPERRERPSTRSMPAGQNWGGVSSERRTLLRPGHGAG